MKRFLHRRCRGFTLIEMVLSLTLTVLAGGIALSILARQQRLYRGINDMMAVREQVRDASDILTAALRATSVTADTLQLATDTAIEFFSEIGASTLCATPSGPALSLPPDTLASGAILTAWLSTPDTGDYALVFHDSTTTSPTRGWDRFRIQRVSSRPVTLVCSLSSPFITPADIATSAKAYEVTLSAAPSPPIHAGAPVRFIRRGRYSVYRASDRQWYLGYRRCGATCDVVQPVSGPYQNQSAPPITFRYYRSNGSLLYSSSPSTGVVRVDIIARGGSAETLQIPGFPRTAFTDSTITSVAFRNRQ